MYHDAYTISHFVPDDFSKQTSAMELCERILINSDIITVIDLGCGQGDSIDVLHKIKPDIEWKGVDLEDSSEVRLRTRKGKEFIVFDGINIPLNDNSIDLILCKQVLEHVTRPRELLKDVARILKTNGYFVGSTSHLEAFHSLSCWNYTPYGFKLLLDEAGFNIIEMRSGIDVITLLLCRFFNRIPILGVIFNRYFKHESPINYILGLLLKLAGKNHREINLWKLLICGHFVFLAQKKG